MTTNNNKINVIPAEAVQERFDRLENKIDKLSEVMVLFARTEERLIAMEQERESMRLRLNRHSEKLDELGETVRDNTRTTSNITKGFWIVVTVAIGSLFSQITGINFYGDQ